MKRIAIIGGGISGLSAAYTIEKQRLAGVPVTYSLFESGSGCGGVLRTETLDDCLLEAGPDSFLSEKKAAADLCRELGIGDQLIGSNDKDRKTYILVKGKLVPLPDGLMFMVPTNFAAAAVSPLFSFGTKIKIAAEWFQSRRRTTGDESVASFIERHYGPEMVERLADPLLSGVYGGEAKSLSVQSILPRFVEMEARFGSLGRAMVFTRLHGPRRNNAVSIFTTMRDGMQTLPDALASSLDSESLHLNCPVRAIDPTDRGWIVHSDSQPFESDSIILALPGWASAALVGPNSPRLAEELASIPYTSSITVGLTYDAEVRASLPPGFGFLVPRNQGLRLMAATFVHNKFPHRAPEDRALLRCFLGGTSGESLLDLTDDAIVEVVRSELKSILGVSAAPGGVRVNRWRKAMAQYSVGHRERLEKIQSLLKACPGLYLAGNAYQGIGISDCIRSGRNAADQALADAGVTAATSH